MMAVKKVDQMVISMVAMMAERLVVKMVAEKDGMKVE
jgi:hypothetical protein